MKNKHILELYLIILSIASSAISQVADSPWPMFGHDLLHTGRSLYQGPEVPILKWIYPFGFGANSGSAVVGPDGTVYVIGENWFLHAIRPDGSLKWRLERKMEPTQPTIASDGTIYACTNDSSLVAVDPRGAPKWSFRTGAFVGTPPAIGPDGTVYCGSHDRNFYALNPDGSKKWSFSTKGYIRTSPAIDPDGIIYFGSADSNLYALYPNSTKKFSFKTGGRVGFSAPAIGRDGTVYFGSDDARFYALNPGGTQKWSYKIATASTYQVVSSPALGTDGTVYFAAKTEGFIALNPDGSKKWSYNMDATGSTPLIDSDGDIFIGSYDGNLYAFKPDSTKKWSFKIGIRIMSNPVMDQNSTIYVLSGSDGKFYAVCDSLPPNRVEMNRLIEDRSFHLCQNYPNPFNADTKIRFYLKKSSDVSLKIFDVRGGEICTLMEGKVQEGDHAVTWHAESQPSGMYFYRLETVHFSKTGKMILLK